MQEIKSRSQHIHTCVGMHRIAENNRCEGAIIWFVSLGVAESFISQSSGPMTSSSEAPSEYENSSGRNIDSLDPV